MIKIVLLVAFVGTAYAVGADYRTIQIVKSDAQNDGSGNFQYEYEASDGAKAGATGSFQPGPKPEEGTQNIQGFSSYTSPEGEVIQLQYDAGAGGFNPRGSHIPTPHPIPEYILRAIEYNAKNPPHPDTLLRA